jgi:N-acetylglutamate synthase-like GNAT family acetyltransferase
MLEVGYLADFPEYLVTVAEWGHGQWGYLDPGKSLEDRVRKRREYLQRGAIPMTVIAFQDGIPVGTASLEAHDMEERPELTPWMSSVYVAPEFRRRGIASALVNRIVDEARGLGVAELFLFTFDRKDLYEGLGWRVVQEDTYHGWNVTIMNRTIEPRQ